MLIGVIMSLGMANEADYFKYKSSLTTEHKQTLLRSVENPTMSPITAETQDHQIDLLSFCRGLPME
jgi:hypothetical protein